MNTDKEPIAIVGIGCRLPGGLDTPNQLWLSLCEGRDGMRSVPPDRWDSRRFYDPDPSKPGKMALKEGGFLAQRLDEFDAQFFNISPREAEQIDPQQRLLLEVSWEAFEDAGIVPATLRGSKTGVFIGGFFTDMSSFRHGSLARNTIGAQTATGASHTMLSARLSYFFDFRGPAFTIDSACSSSLVAIHQACASVASGESQLALAGGVSIMLLPEPAITCTKGGFLSVDCRSKSFDQSANGYARGEGSVVFVLKKLSDALRDGNCVYATILATGVNQDGFTNGITVPNGDAQRELIRGVVASAGVDQRQIRYVEAHGTGTPVGDPIEIRAIGEALEQRPEGPRYVGSIKSNFGHLEGAAGAVGVLKAALCVKNRAVPPNLHFVTPNGSMDLEGAGLRVPTELVDLGAAPERIIAGVNSFGYGGTNAFALVSEHIAPEPRAVVQPVASHADAPPLPVLLSARSPGALRALASELVVQLRQRRSTDQLPDIAHTLANHRTHHEYRASLIARTSDEAAKKLEAFVTGQAKSDVTQRRVLAAGADRLVFIYTGMGPQWWGMARSLIEQEAEFRAQIAECDRISREWCDWSLLTELLRPEEQSRVTDVRIAQSANFAVQVALTRLLESRGVRASAVLGHSIGEVAAAHCCGALSLEDGLRVAFHRARLQHTRSGKGTMLAAGISEAQAKQIVEANSGVLSLAAVNGPESVTLAGDVTTLKRVSAQLTFKEVFNKFLKVDVAYHSYQMEGLRDDLERALARLQPRAPHTEFVSSVTGAADPGALDAGYWWRNLRDTVQFAEAASSILRAGPAMFLEVGPHPVLAASLQSILRHVGVEGACLPTLVRDRPQRDCFYESIAALHTAGHHVDWHAVSAGRGKLVSLPHYTWDRKSHWLESEASRQDRLDVGRHSLLVHPLSTAEPAWEVELNRYLFDFLADHVVAGRALLPGALFVEAGLIASREIEGRVCALADVGFHDAVVIRTGERPMLQVHYDSAAGRFSVLSGSAGAEHWRVCASGTARRKLELHEPSPPDFERLFATPGVDFSAEAFYQLCRERGLEYGPYFQGVRRVHAAGSWVVAEIVPGVAFNENDNRYVLHPTYLDSAFQTLIALQAPNIPAGTIVPVGADEVRFHHSPRGRVWSYAVLRGLDEKASVADVVLCDEAGRVCIEVRGLRCASLTSSSSDAEILADSLYRFSWLEVPMPGAAAPSAARSWVQVNGSSLAADVAELLARSGCPCAQLALTGGPRGERAGVVPESGAEDSLGSLKAYDPAGELTIVYWLPEGAPPASERDIWDASLAPTLELAELVRACSARTAPTDIWIVTRGTQQVGSEAVHNCIGASLWGMARVVRMEHPLIHCRLLDLDPAAASSPEQVLSLLAELGAETELAFRGERRYARRLQRLRFSDDDIAALQTATPAATTCVEFVEGALGQGEGFSFRSARRRDPAEREVEVAVSSVGVEPHDLGPLLTRGVLPRSTGDQRIQVEAFGHVVRTGSGVGQLEVGTQVYLPTLPALRSLLTLDADACVATASSPTCFPGDLAIAMYCLEEVARIQPGERVVVCGADTPIGLAAAWRALRLGARVLAVAKPAAQEDLRRAGVGDIAASGRVDTVDEIAEWLGGADINLILACDDGEEADASLRLLAPLGTLIRTSTGQGNLAIPATRAGFNYAQIDAARLRRSPKLFRRFWERALQALGTTPGIGREPLKVSMAERQSRPRILAELERSAPLCPVELLLEHDPVPVQPLLGAEPIVHPDATYLVTGGLSGFGLETAKWLAAQGATQLLLVSRRGLSDPATKTELERLEQAGCHVRVEPLDVASSSAPARLRQALEGLPPLRGVIHSAMVLRDGTLADSSARDFEDVMRPKVMGAWTLHELTRDQRLDFFVLYSSVASVLGAYGQGNYVAANAFVEQFTLFRRSLGLPCQVVSWGALSETGTVARDQRIAQYLAKIGVSGLTTAQALAGLDLSIRARAPFLGVMRVNWDEWGRFSTGAPLYSQVLPARFAASAEKRTQLSDHDAVIASRSIIASTLKLPLESINGNVPLSNLGIDSLLSVEIVAAIEQELDVRIPTREVLEKPTLDELSAEIVRRLKAKREGLALGATA